MGGWAGFLNVAGKIAFKTPWFKWPLAVSSGFCALPGVWMPTGKALAMESACPAPKSSRAGSPCHLARGEGKARVPRRHEGGSRFHQNRHCGNGRRTRPELARARGDTGLEDRGLPAPRCRKKVNVQNVVMEGDILLHAPKSSPSHETNALEFRARLNFLRLQ